MTRLIAFTKKNEILTWSFIVDISLSNISCVLRVESKLKYNDVAPTTSKRKCCCRPPSLPAIHINSKIVSLRNSHERGGSGTSVNDIY